MCAIYAIKTDTASSVHAHPHEQLRGKILALTIDLVIKCQGNVICQHTYNAYRARLARNVGITPCKAEQC